MTPSTALFGVASTNTSTGSANASYDSFTPMGGFGLLTGMMLGEVTPGGTGSGLYTILIYAIIAVFIGGLMIGRTPGVPGEEDPGHGGETRRAWARWSCRSWCSIVTAIAVSVHAGRAGPLNAGPHGFSEILYALTSQGNNNGSAFGGLTGNTAFYNIIGAHRHADRPVRDHDPGPGPRRGAGGQERGARRRSGTFRTDNAMFVGLTIGVIIIIGGLTFFPAVSLGPIVEQLSHGKFF